MRFSSQNGRRAPVLVLIYCSFGVAGSQPHSDTSGRTSCSGESLLYEIVSYIIGFSKRQFSCLCFILFSSYTYEDEEGVFPESQFVFDLELPLEFKPIIGDGEVQEFYLLPIDKVSVFLIL